MNSILQCLSNTVYLLEYCLDNSYVDDLNKTMSVMKGSLFSSYATLIKNMWKSEEPISPHEFKSQIARFAPRFVGYAQQDAEGLCLVYSLFLSFLFWHILLIIFSLSFSRVSLLSTKRTSRRCKLCKKEADSRDI